MNRRFALVAAAIVIAWASLAWNFNNWYWSASLLYATTLATLAAFVVAAFGRPPTRRSAWHSASDASYLLLTDFLRTPAACWDTRCFPSMLPTTAEIWAMYSLPNEARPPGGVTCGVVLRAVA